MEAVVVVEPTDVWQLGPDERGLHGSADEAARYWLRAERERSHSFARTRIPICRVSLKLRRNASPRAHNRRHSPINSPTWAVYAAKRSAITPGAIQNRPFSSPLPRPLPHQGA